MEKQAVKLVRRVHGSVHLHLCCCISITGIRILLYRFSWTGYVRKAGGKNTATAHVYVEYSKKFTLTLLMINRNSVTIMNKTKGYIATGKAT
jgi:hypothetical protein